MASIETRTLKARVEAMRRWQARPKRLHIRLFFLRHGRNATSKPCSCCASDQACLVNSQLIDEKIIDTESGRSWILSQVKNKEAFRQMAEECDKSIDWRLKVSDLRNDEGIGAQDLLLDFETLMWVVGGGNRSGKTHNGCVWLAVRWFYFGKSKTKFCAIAPELQQSHVMVDKLIRGEEGQDPIFDPAFVLECPEDENKRGQIVVMIDGTEIYIRHAKSANAIKSKRYAFILWTEVTSCLDSKLLTILTMRTADQAGQLYLDSTPESNHWLLDSCVKVARDQAASIVRRDQLVSKAQTEALTEAETADLQSLADVQITTRLLALSSALNPWIDPAEIAKRRALLMKHNPAQARREIDGEWCSDRDSLFSANWDPTQNIIEHYVPDHFKSIADRLGGPDITRLVTRAFFRTHCDWIIGSDINFKPTTFVMAKVFGDIKNPDTWGIYIHDSEAVNNMDTERASQFLKNIDNGVYAGAAMAVDYSSENPKSVQARRMGGARTQIQDFKNAGFAARGVFKSYRDNECKIAPRIEESIQPLRNLMSDRKLLVNSVLANQVIEAIERCEDAGNGKPYKQSNTTSDREIVNYIDCLRYMVWSVLILSPNATTKVIR